MVSTEDIDNSNDANTIQDSAVLLLLEDDKFLHTTDLI
jgi:hypothetical protein